MHIWRKYLKVLGQNLSYSGIFCWLFIIFCLAILKLEFQMALFDSLRATKTRILSHELWLNLINVKL